MGNGDNRAVTHRQAELVCCPMFVCCHRSHKQAQVKRGGPLMNMEQQARGAGAAAVTPSLAQDEIAQLRALSIEPNQCPLAAPVALTLRIALAVPVPAAFWTLQYEADIAMKRHVIPMLTTAPPRDLAAGEHVIQLATDGIATAGVKEKYLLQVGMLKLGLHSAAPGGGDSAGSAPPLVSINMVTQVAKDDQGVLKRNVISPLEE
jgi:hypothetical protein